MHSGCLVASSHQTWVPPSQSLQDQIILCPEPLNSRAIIHIPKSYSPFFPFCSWALFIVLQKNKSVSDLLNPASVVRHGVGDHTVLEEIWSVIKNAYLAQYVWLSNVKDDFLPCLANNPKPKHLLSPKTMNWKNTQFLNKFTKKHFHLKSHLSSELKRSGQTAETQRRGQAMSSQPAGQFSCSLQKWTKMSTLLFF